MTRLLTIAICTTGVNDVLACLQSAVKQRPSEGWQTLNPIVIVNQRELELELVSKIKEKFPQVKVGHEKIIGIPWARNLALDESLRQGTEWIVFVDDDCVPKENWLKQLTLAADTHSADCVMGEVEYRPKGTPSPYVPRRHWGTPFFSSKGLSDGEQLLTAYTHSVLFRPIYLNGSPSPMQFDVTKTDAGGEDAKYFRDFPPHGRKIVFAANSRVIEYYAGERLTLKWHFLRRLSDTTNYKPKTVLGSKSGLKRKSKLFYLISLANITLAIINLAFLLIPSLVLPLSQLKSTVGKSIITLAFPIGIFLSAIGFRYGGYSKKFRFAPKIPQQ